MLLPLFPGSAVFYSLICSTRLSINILMYRRFIDKIFYVQIIEEETRIEQKRSYFVLLFSIWHL